MAKAGEITENNKRGIGDVYQSTSSFNANNQQINSLLQKINTVFLARILSVKSSGVNGSKTVVAQPLICQIDANGNALPSPKLVEIPHYRIQAGTGAIILDPIVGDIGVFVCCKRDSSGVKNGTTDPQVPASFRSFDLADSVMIATIRTGTPTTYIHINPETQTIEIKAPSSLTINTPSATLNATNATVNATKTTLNGEVEINGNLAVNGGMTSTGDLDCGGISFLNHVHGGIMAGNSDTGTPK